MTVSAWAPGSLLRAPLAGKRFRGGEALDRGDQRRWIWVITTCVHSLIAMFELLLPPPLFPPPRRSESRADTEDPTDLNFRIRLNYVVGNTPPAKL